MSRLYVVDNTVLSNFGRIQRPDLLELAIAPDGLIPPAVRRERELGESLGVLPRLNWQWLPVAALDTVEQGLAEALRTWLDAGEAECLAVAINRNGTIVTDDRAARRQATLRGVAVSGTLGVLRKLVSEGRLSVSEADEYLAAMMAQGFRSPVKSLEKLS